MFNCLHQMSVRAGPQLQPYGYNITIGSHAVNPQVKSVFQLDYKIGLEPSELKQTDLSGMENIIAQMIMFEIEASILSVRMRYSSIDLVISSLNIYVHFYLQLLSALAFYENKKKEEGSVMPIRDFSFLRWPACSRTDRKEMIR